MGVTENIDPAPRYKFNTDTMTGRVALGTKPTARAGGI